jgi:hypothetical protein
MTIAVTGISVVPALATLHSAIQPMSVTLLSLSVKAGCWILCYPIKAQPFYLGTELLIYPVRCRYICPAGISLGARPPMAPSPEFMQDLWVRK